MNHTFGRSALALGFITLSGVASAQNFDVIDFESVTPGTLVTSLFANGGTGPIGISGTNSLFPGTNTALIFDSANPTGGDVDLGTPNQAFGGPGIGGEGGPGSTFPNDTALGNLLIVAEDIVDGNNDNLVDDPDDADVVGSTLTFDFSAVGAVTVDSMNLIDVEADETPPSVELLDGGGSLITTIALPNVGDNGVASIDLGGVAGVVTMRVILNGSGAIDAVAFRSDDIVPYCIADQNDCPCGNNAGNSGCVNSTGNGGLLAGSGSTNVVTDDLILMANGLPNGGNALFFMATDQTRSPFVDGLRCVGGGSNKVLRLPPPQAVTNGTATFGPGIVNFSCTQIPILGCITAGSTWNFQVWYEDASGPCGNGSNLTNALAVTFQ